MGLRSFFAGFHRVRTATATGTVAPKPLTDDPVLAAHLEVHQGNRYWFHWGYLHHNSGGRVDPDHPLRKALRVFENSASQSDAEVADSIGAFNVPDGPGRAGSLNMEALVIALAEKRNVYLAVCSGTVPL